MEVVRTEVTYNTLIGACGGAGLSLDQPLKQPAQDMKGD